MSLSRRALLGGSGRRAEVPAGVLIAARGREALVAESWPEPVEAQMIPPPAPGEIRISSNENPLGPGAKVVEAIESTYAWSFRYPSNTEINMRTLREGLADAHGTEPVNVVLGAGSGEVLKNAAHARCSQGQPYVTAAPSYKDSDSVVRYFGGEIRAPVVDSEGKLDLDAMAEEAPGAGMVYVCNPNNPTGTVHSADAIASFVERVRSAEPDALILIDEAYHEYVTEPAYESAIPLALETPNVVVARTFSKAFGLAGMRIGWGIGHPEVMQELRGYELTFDTNVLGLAAAWTAMNDPAFVEQERQRNSEVKAYTIGFFEDAGFEVWDSQTNFFFVNIGRPARDFRGACAEQDVLVGRDFPPYEETHCRISIGTMEEMRQACGVFADVLGVDPPADPA